MQRGISVSRLSDNRQSGPFVHLPVCERVNCDNTKESSAHYERSIHLVLRHEEWLVRTFFSTWNFKPNWPILLDNVDFQWIRSASAVIHAKKSSITNKKSMTGFSLSLRWRVYVVFKPPKRVKNANWLFFRIKVDLSARKSAIKFRCAKKFSGKVVRYSPTYLTQWWVMADVISYLKLCAQVTYPPQYVEGLQEPPLGFSRKIFCCF